jgi:ureidoacrylate peracid hydrolase
LGDRGDAFRAAIRVDPARTALLVVDMQRAFVEPGQAMEVPPARDVIPRIEELIGIFREKRLPVVFTEFIYSPAAPLLVGELHPGHRPAAPGAPTGFGLPSSSCLEGEDNARVISDLAPRPDELVIRKHYYDGFNGTVLDGALRARGVTTLAITGTMTDICVLGTVIGAFNREYRLIVVGDGVATLWPEIQRATLDIIRRAYARVLSAKELADELARVC